MIFYLGRAVGLTSLGPRLLLWKCKYETTELICNGNGISLLAVRGWVHRQSGGGFESPDAQAGQFAERAVRKLCCA